MNYYIITYGCQMNWNDSERIAVILEKIGYKPSLNENEADLIVINMCSVRQSAVNRVYGKIENFVKFRTQNQKLYNSNVLECHSHGSGNPEIILTRLDSRFHGNDREFIKYANPEAKILLTGCILKRDIKKFKDKVDYIFPIKSLKHWPEFLKREKFIYYPNQRDLEFNKKFNLEYFKIQSCRKNKFSAFVPISTGCDNFCSYCVVPYLRGPEISRPAEDIISEVKNLIEKGYKEIWLLGQNVNSYKSGIRNKCWLHSGDSPVEPFAQNKNHNSAPHPCGTMEPAFIKKQNSKQINFSGLLKMVNNIPGDFWIRFISPHPKDFSDELIEVMAKCEKVTPYLNLPVQSGDNEILKKMNRSYTVEQYENLAKKIRKKFIKIRGKDVLFCLTTDIIVGFQGETKKQFKNTVKLFQEIKFDMAYISQYSSRPVREEFNQVNYSQDINFSNGVRSGTTVFNLENDVTQKEKKERDKILTEVLKKTALENNKQYIGRETEALLEFEKNGWLIGKTKEYKTVKIKIPRPHRYTSLAKRCGRANPKSQTQKVIRDFVNVKITEAYVWGLKGELIP